MASGSIQNTIHQTKFKELVNSSYEFFVGEAISRGLISTELYYKYAKFKNAAKSYQDVLIAKNRSADDLKDLFQKIEGLTEQERLQLSNFMVAEYSILTSLEAIERAINTPTPEERIGQLFDFLFKKFGAKAPEIIADISSKIQNEKTYTTHPTILHKLTAIMLEHDIITEGEELVAQIKSGKQVDNKKLQVRVSDLITAALTPRTTPLTHYTKVALAEESALERHNTPILQEQDKIAIKAWNRVVTRDSRLNINTHGISKKALSRRTWNISDADGRKYSNSLALWDAISQKIAGNGSFEGPILDFRDNAKQNEALVSALVQVAVRKSAGKPPYPTSNDNGEFAKFCHDFVQGLNVSDLSGTWRNPNESIYQELNSHKASFMRELLLSDFNLVPESVVAHSVPFARAYSIMFKKFVEEYNLRNTPELPQHVTFADLAKYSAPDGKYENLQLAFRQHVKETKVLFYIGDKQMEWNFEIDEEGLYYKQDSYFGEPDYFKQRKFLDENGEIKELSKDERNKCMDMLRRLEIIRYFAKIYGPNVIADRFQIANFSGPENFYELMLLFKQSKLLKIEDGKVTESKIGIMPLLETLEDLENAEAIFSKLLEDPLVLSYFQARGNVAQIMVGFSDGAKSAGNFASEFGIYQATAKLERLFASHGITVDFKQGRGNNNNRGGTLDDGLAQAMMPNNLNATGKSSVTVQADHPTARAKSMIHGTNQAASSLIGGASGVAAATTKTTAQKEFEAECEKSFEFIAKVSAHYFQKLVRNNPEAERFINKVPYNSDSSSRAAARGKSTYEDMRAVPVAIKADMTNHPLHYVGLKRALNALVDKKSICINGETLKVPEITDLNILKKHPFFENFMRKHEAALMRNFDANIARSYANYLETHDFTETIISEVEGLREIFQKTLREVCGYTRFEPRQSEISAEIAGTVMVSHGLLVKGAQKPNIKKPDEEVEAITQRNALFVAASGDCVGKPSPRQLQVPQRVFGLN